MVSLGQTVIKNAMMDETMLVGSEHGWCAPMIWKHWLIQEQLTYFGEPQGLIRVKASIRSIMHKVTLFIPLFLLLVSQSNVVKMPTQEFFVDKLDSG